MLEDLARQKTLTDFDLTEIATGLTIVQPERLRNSRLAVECAQKLIEHSQGRKAAYFLTLSQAYRCAGQSAQAQVSAQQGLKLLPPSANTIPSYLRKQLEAEAHK
jgi:hypothetical protein